MTSPCRIGLACKPASSSSNPEVAMVGSSCRIVDASGEVVRDVLAQCADAELLSCNPYFQRRLMVRRKVLVEIGGYSYDPMYLLSENYEMMSRVAMRHRVANLPQLRRFSSCTPGLKQTTRVRAVRYYRWGKHAAALSWRESWGLKARVALLVDAIKLLSYGGRLLAKGAVGGASATIAP